MNTTNNINDGGTRKFTKFAYVTWHCRHRLKNYLSLPLLLLLLLTSNILIRVERNTRILWRKRRTRL